MRKKDQVFIPDCIRRGRHALWIMPEEFDPQHGYVAIAAVEGIPGVYRTKLYCGFDYEMAVWYTDRKNLSMGIDTKVASAIIISAMGNWPLNDLPI